MRKADATIEQRRSQATDMGPELDRVACRKVCQVNLRRLDARQRVPQQRLVPGGVLCDAIIGKPQRFLLRGCEVPQHDHRYLGDAERFRRRQPAMACDQHAILVHQQRICEAEGLHAGHDLRELRFVMHTRIAGMRAQRGNRAELDPLGHPGKRHGGYPGRVALRFAPKLLKSRRKGANHAGAGCKPSANLKGLGLHLSH